MSELQEEALRVFRTVLGNNICLELEWIPRELNKTEDMLSMIVDYDDWSMNPSIFSCLDCFWGPHTVVNSNNTQ